MKRRKRYLQLTYEDRRLLSHWKAKGLRPSEIARRLNVHRSTICRELKRNGQVTTREDQLFWQEVSLAGHPPAQVQEFLARLAPKLRDRVCWTALDAQRTREMRLYAAQSLRRRKKPETRAWVIQKLRQSWGPEQIAGRSRLEGPEPVSYEFVYRLIHQDRKRGGKLFHCLKRFRKRKQRLGARQYPGGPLIPNRVSIENRPAIVNQRSRLGDLEGDLIQGYNASGYVLSVVDRKSRLLTLRKLKTKRKRTVLVQLERALRKMGRAHTLTLDNGTEFCSHEALTAKTGVRVYFAHPYCSTDKGSIENANALVRYFLPKKTSFARLNQSKLNEIEALLNNRPRKCLGYLTPSEVHSKRRPEISHIQPVALLT